jgi:hypothetical protein
MSDVTAAVDFILSMRSKCVSRPKLFPDSGVAGGEGGREGKGCTLVGGFWWGATVNTGDCEVFLPDLFGHLSLNPDLDPLIDDTCVARLRALTSELLCQFV